MAVTDSALKALLLDMLRLEASDLHLVAGYRPIYRIHGELQPAFDDILDAAAIRAMLAPLLESTEALRCGTGFQPVNSGSGVQALNNRSQSPNHQITKSPNSPDLDFAWQLDDAGRARRFRVNVFSARGELGACFRAIPDDIPTLPELGFPSELGMRIISQRNGLVLLTGITGSGKTTTLAALIQMLNTAQGASPSPGAPRGAAGEHSPPYQGGAGGGYRIITIEEPIEYIYPVVGSSVITQREVGVDVPSFYEGLRSALRQDPDVILVGEIRDRETAQLAISGAETGHLIFATLHTIDAKGAVTRLIDLFPAERHDDIRTQLSMSLRYVISQHLLPAKTGGRRVLALEALFANFAVRSAIRQGKIESLESAIQAGRQDGMFSLDADLQRLVERGLITPDTARSHAKDPSEF